MFIQPIKSLFNNDDNKKTKKVINLSIDIETATTKPAPKTPPIIQVNPNNKSWLEVLNMV